MSGTAPSKKTKRTSARQAAVQALFQISVTGASPERVIREFLDRPVTDSSVAHKPQFRRIVTGAAGCLTELDATIDPLLGERWSLKRIDTTLLCVLRCAIWELHHASRKAPARVVIAEYLKVAYGFAEDGEIRFANALLDRVARSARVSEFA